MTTTTTPRREETLRAVIAHLDDRRDGILPMHLAGVSEHFGDQTTLLGALQLRWYTHLSGDVERELADRPYDHADAVATAWARAATEMSGVRAAIDLATADPADAEMAANLERARTKEHTMLAALAGQAGWGAPQAPALGARLEERARALVGTLAVVPEADAAQPHDGARDVVVSLVRRLRDRVA